MADGRSVVWTFGGDTASLTKFTQYRGRQNMTSQPGTSNVPHQTHGHHHATGADSGPTILSDDEYDSVIVAERLCYKKGDQSACNKLKHLLKKACPDSVESQDQIGTSEYPASSAWACFDLGQLHTHLKAPENAVRYYQRACDHKHYRGCYNLAMM